MSRLIEEEGMEREERLEGVRGMLEGVVEGVSYDLPRDGSPSAQRLRVSCRPTGSTTLSSGSLTNGSACVLKKPSGLPQGKTQVN